VIARETIEIGIIQIIRIDTKIKIIETEEVI